MISLLNKGSNYFKRDIMLKQYTVLLVKKNVTATHGDSLVFNKNNYC